MSVIEIEINGNAVSDVANINIHNNQESANPYEKEVHQSIVDMIQAFFDSHKRINNAKFVNRKGGAK